MTRRRAVEVGLVALVGALAGLQFGRVFGTGAVVVATVGAAAGAAIAAAVCGIGRDRPMVLDLAISLVAMVLFTCAVAPHSPPPLPTPQNLSGMADGLVNGWARILSTSLPVRPDPALLAIVPVSTWVTTWFGAELVRRTRSVVWPVVPPLLTFLLATFLGIGGAGGGVVVSLAFAASGLALIAVRSAALRSGGVEAIRPEGEPSRTGAQVVTALVAFAVVAGVVAAAIPGLRAMAREPYDPRADRPLPLEDLSSLSPLSTLKAELKRPPAPVFTVAFTRPDGSSVDPGAEPLVRLTVLDSYDGNSWRGGGDYFVTGENVPDDEPPPATSVEIGQDVTIAGLDSVWLPAAARPMQILGADAVGANPETGVLVHRGTTAGYHYRVRSAVPVITPQDVLGTGVDTTRPDRYTQVPVGVPDTITSLARDATTGVGDPYQKLAAIETYLRDNFTYSLDAPTGHSLGQLSKKFLVGGGAGTAEQFSATFALMARSLGYPARIVVGYRPGAPGPDGVVQVMSSDLFAWPEVAFAGVGWIPFDPTPVPGIAPAAETLQTEVQTPDAETPTAGPGEGAQSEVPPETTTAAESPRQTPWWVWVLVGVGAALVCCLAAAGLLFALRRRRTASRRQAPDLRVRVAGAWAEALDLVDIAYANGRDTSAMTAHEVAEFAVEHAGVEAARRLVPLGHLADIALFDPDGPDRTQAAQAWTHLDDLESLLEDHTKGMRRIRLTLDPRRRRRETASSPEAG